MLHLLLVWLGLGQAFDFLLGEAEKLCFLAFFDVGGECDTFRLRSEGMCREIWALVVNLYFHGNVLPEPALDLHFHNSLATLAALKKATLTKNSALSN